MFYVLMLFVIYCLFSQLSVEVFRNLAGYVWFFSVVGVLCDLMQTGLRAAHEIKLKELEIDLAKAEGIEYEDEDTENPPLSIDRTSVSK